MLQFTAPGRVFAPAPPLRQSVVVPVGLSTAETAAVWDTPARALSVCVTAAQRGKGHPADLALSFLNAGRSEARTNRFWSRRERLLHDPQHPLALSLDNRHQAAEVEPGK